MEVPAAHEIARMNARQIAEAIERATRGHVARPLAAKVARAAEAGLVSRGELAAKLAYIAARIDAGTILSPGAYFATCAREWFRRGGVEWQPRQRRA